MTKNSVFVMEITQDMVGRHLLIQGQSMFADQAFGMLSGNGSEADSQTENAYEIPPGMTPLDAMTDWVIRFVSDAPGKKATVAELRDALPETLVGLYQTPGSARSAVSKAVQKGIDAETLTATGTGSADIVRKAPRKRKPKNDNVGAQADDNSNTGNNPDGTTPGETDQNSAPDAVQKQAPSAVVETKPEDKADTRVIKPEGQVLSSTRPDLQSDVGNLEEFGVEETDGEPGSVI